MTSEKYNTLGKGTAVISFIIGALIFGIYFLTSNSDLLFIGYGFIVLAGIANLIILIAILAKSKSDSTNRKRLLKTSRLMLINLPIMFLFIWFSLILIGNMRITFTNSTQNKLTNIKIVGCETEYISELNPNESKTVWVEITGDCSITLEYLENGELKKETVATYVTNGMGQKMKHKIDGKDKDII
jgi:membrane-bound ClpP family serine protease